MPPYTEDSEPHSRTSAHTHSASPAPGSSTGASKQRERSPEPDEDLDMTESATSMWLVRVPRYLRKAWQEVSEADKLLGTVRVYDPDHRGNQRMELLLPQVPNAPVPLQDSKVSLEAYKNIPRVYDLRIAPTETTAGGGGGGASVSRNMYAFKEWDESRSGDEASEPEDEVDEDARDKKRKRTALIGGVTNEVVAQPQVKLVPGERGAAPRVGITDEYRALLRQRRIESSKPKHTVQLLDEKDVAINNRLAAGVSAAGFTKGTSTTTSFVPTKQKTTTEKFARLPRNELLDLLMEAFDRYPYWSIKGLRQHTQQPEAYLREVLSGIADLHKRGPYNGNWSLKKDYVDVRGPVQAATSTSSAGQGAQLQQQEAEEEEAEDFDQVV